MPKNSQFVVQEKIDRVLSAIPPEGIRESALAEKTRL